MLVTAAMLAGSAGVSALSAAEPVRIVALGDSLTSGHRLPRSDAYPARLEGALKDEGLDAVVINHGVSGDTSTGGVRRLAAALADRPDILLVALGINDGLRGVPVATVRRNLEQIIETAQQQQVAVLLCAMEALPVNGWQYTVDFHNLYRELAAKYRVPLVPFMLLGVLGNADLMSSDGVHPNAAGAKVMAAAILPHLRPLAETTKNTKNVATATKTN
jgi:acyl-CoA thioesterase-1